MSQTKAQLLGPVLGDVNYDSGTLFVDSVNNRVGIGNTTPTELLHLSSTGSAKLKITADTDNITEADVASIEISQDGGITTGAFGLDGTNNLVLGVNSTTSPNIYIGTRNDGTSFISSTDAKLTILNSGNVGIGTTTPDEKLQVVGTVRTVGGYLKLTGSSTPDHENYIQMAGNGTSFIGVGAEASPHILFKVGATNAERLRVTNLGINVTDGDRFRYTARRIAILGGPQDGTYKGYVILAKAYPGGTVEASYVTGNIILRRGSAGSGHNLDVYYVNSSTGFQSETFLVNALAKFEQRFSRLVKVTYSGVVYHAIETVSVGGQPAVEMHFNGSMYDSPLIMVDETYVSNVTAFGTIGLHITQTGSVGIGTANPTAKLSVLNDIAPTASTSDHVSYSDGTRSGAISLTGATYSYAGVGGNELWYYANGSFSALTFGSDGTVPIKLVSGGSERVRVTSGGNVGVGITNPSEKLTVFGAENIISANESGTSSYWRARILSKNSGADKAAFLGIYANNPGVFAHNHALTAWAPLYINTTSGSDGANVILAGSGNVAIGTNTAGYKLTVVGTGSLIQRDLYITGNTGNPYGNRLIVGNTDTVYTLQDGNLRPTIQIHGGYPVLSLNHTITSNTAHGGTIQFTSDGVGNQFVIGATGNGTRLDIGTSSYNNWNPHNGIANLNGPTHMSFTTTGNVGVGITNPGNKFVVNGYIQTPNDAGGLDIGYKKGVSITGSFAANTWYNTGIDRTTDTGIYIVQAYIDTYNTGQSYQMRYTGLFGMPNQASNSGDAQTITLHRAGHAPNAETLQLRTLLTPSVNGGIIYLQWASNMALTLNNNIGNSLQIYLFRLSSGV
jgi:hypothetical protein